MVTGNDVQTVYTDGAYQSKENRKFAEDNGIEFIANGIQGKPSRFDLEMTDEHTLQVTDKTTAEVQTAIPVKRGQWKIPVESPNGKGLGGTSPKSKWTRPRFARKLNPSLSRKGRNATMSRQPCYNIASIRETTRPDTAQR